MSTFSELNLLPSLQKTLAERGLIAPTEIQGRVLPALLAGKSVVGIAQTGTGKTLAFALPILHMLKTLENNKEAVFEESSPRAAVIVPTRELGEQVARVFKLFTHETRIRVRSVLGGTSRDAAKGNIKGCFEVLVATPGRLLQLMDRGLVKLGDVRILIFDEADQMLDPSFLTDATDIANDCKPERQLGLFSATISKEVQALIKGMFSKAAVISAKDSGKLVASLKTKNRFVTDGIRFPFLREELAKGLEGGTMIFVNTREQCDDVAEKIRDLGQQCVVYRGEMNKVERRSNLQSFRDGKVKVLVSTDLASRGLDVDCVSHVINYHLPHCLENYIHRVGRTARAGRQGTVVNLITKRDMRLIDAIERAK